MQARKPEMRGWLATLTTALVFAVSTPASAGGLAAPSSFAGIEDAEARSAAIFTEAARVFQHARCMNCHPAGDRPLQTDASHKHRPAVQRGSNGFGHPAMQCGNCHMDSNRAASGVPGAPHWHLAQSTMGFVGKTPGQICRQIKNPNMNGDRPTEAIVMHVAFDPLIIWAWQPGADRTAPPGTHQDFVALINEWIVTGAACPER